MARSRKYTAAQRRAYETGKAYKLGREGRKIKFKNASTRASFQAGYKADVSRYEKIK